MYIHIHIYICPSYWIFKDAIRFWWFRKTLVSGSQGIPTDWPRPTSGVPEKRCAGAPVVMKHDWKSSINRKIMGKPWENHGKIMENSP